MDSDQTVVSRIWVHTVSGNTQQMKFSHDLQPRSQGICMVHCSVIYSVKEFGQSSL